jgi:dienelactone hydrolase
MVFRFNLKSILLSAVLLCVGISILSAEPEKITFPSKDGLIITADLYAPHKKASPFILLCHMAFSSRGEYLEIAPKLNSMGFNCLAIDQRSGKAINGIINETAKMAGSKNPPARYIDAIPDMVSAMEYVKKNYPASKIILWGSSYSASLVLVLANENPKIVNGVVSFSPGEYFANQEKSDTYITENAKALNIPVFLTCKADESGRTKAIFDVIPSKNKTFFAPKSGGDHGSAALWETNGNNKEYWEKLTSFLKLFLNKIK